MSGRIQQGPGAVDAAAHRRVAEGPRRRADGPRRRALTPQEVKEVGAGVKQLSLGLTRERQLAGARYMDDPKLLGRLPALLLAGVLCPGAPGARRAAEPPAPVLDLGSGPGPLAFAALDAGAAEVTAADRSKPALALARELAAEAGEALATREWDPCKRRAARGPVRSHHDGPRAQRAVRRRGTARSAGARRCSSRRSRR